MLNPVWLLALAAVFGLLLSGTGAAQSPLTFKTAKGPLEVTPVGHGSLMFRFDGLTIHVDPYARVADYSKLPPADQVWITHNHPDHHDPTALARVATVETRFFADPDTAKALAGSGRVTTLRNGDRLDVAENLRLEAVPAYNLVRGPRPGALFHPKGWGNGYVADFAGFRVYIAGDTECIPEMGRLGPIDLAFLPINLPYTMTPEEAVGCIKVISPAVVIPYHQGDADPNTVAQLLEGSEIEVRVLELP
ncbi:MBL fold metallo-hydrolase [Limnochorda pilosa]|uniref:Metal-dependent hydrolase n=1 Tax=Limnochorda pilosa TaxID=1555112 RepID=A0A0K2SGG8_LIMPI|nr:MBL fold metallo-hydrolase [Limnochorda pilosa]BAS26196.1 metal-dependent hydrolase [Limnochorda pilosa]